MIVLLALNCGVQNSNFFIPKIVQNDNCLKLKYNL